MSDTPADADTMPIEDYLARGGVLTSPANVPPRYRGELLRLMASFVDSELAGSAGFADTINAAPGITARIAAARITLEKADHAERVLALMGDFGADEGRYATHHPWSDRLPRDAALGQARHGEGLFFPDTYMFLRGSSDILVLRQAAQNMRRELERAWAARGPDLPYASPYEALIMASLIEKETGQAADRPMIARVFLNRLKLGMRLQTDPSVIYGLGEAFDGNLTRAHLQTDTPYNTYTRAGLPPSPIALPGRAALHAALHPADGGALYFVARGDGSSQFSLTLEEHNRAVRRYILGKKD